MKTHFLGQAYTSRSLPLAAQTCINLYPEINQSGAGEYGAFLNTPGLKPLINLGAGEARGIYAAPYQGGAFLYVVIGANLYQVSASNNANAGSGSGIVLTSTLVGTLTTSTGRVNMTSNQTQLVVTQPAIAGVPTSWQVATLGNAAAGLTSVANTNTGQGSAGIQYMDGYGLYTSNAGLSQQFGITALEDFTSVNPSQVANAQALPDSLQTIITTQREAWLIGVETTEIWSDTGAPTFPFERTPGGVLAFGTPSPFSALYLDGSVFFITQDAVGTLRVGRTVGYQIEFISTVAIEEVLRSYAEAGLDFVQVFAYGYGQGGHIFYVLNFPMEDATWAYDTTTKAWARRGYRDSNGVLHRDIIAGSALFYGHQMAIDPTNGWLYEVDLNTYTHNGNPIYRERAWPLTAENEMRRMRVDRLEVSAETGVGNQTDPDSNPQVWLEMSFDGGRAWGQSRYQSLGKAGVRYARMLWRKLGIGRRPVARIATTAQTKIALLGANADIKPLSQ